MGCFGSKQAAGGKGEAAHAAPANQPANAAPARPAGGGPPRVMQKGPLRQGTILGRETQNVYELYSMGKELGRGQFGTTYLATQKASGAQKACKCIAKYKIRSEDDREDIRREVAILHHLSGHPNIINLVGAYEDARNVYLVMDVCAGGELYDEILARGHYKESDAAKNFRTMLKVIAHCHNMGVMHRDLKPENFLLSAKGKDGVLQAADFGLSVFFKPGQRFREIVGSPYYIAPEVLRRNYSHEADIWSIGVILYILLCGGPPFYGKTDKAIFDAILLGKFDMKSHPWPIISDSAKDCVKRLLKQSPKERMTAAEALNHPWVREGGEAKDTVLGHEVVSRMQKFGNLCKFKRLGLYALAKTLREEEITGLKQMFAAMDTDESGTITVSELHAGLAKQGYKMAKAEVDSLIEAIDVDGNGELDYHEFTAATVHLSKFNVEENLAKAFAHFDTDNSGYITQDELEVAIKEAGLTGKVQVSELLAEVDKDGDGRVNYDEFSEIMRTNMLGSASARLSKRF